ncbi:hypothetical protein NMG60_11016801 [Bertholletia excelsa]
MKGGDVENKDEAVKTQIAIRCAKAALLLLSLKCSRNRRLVSAEDSQHEEREQRLRTEADDLRRRLFKERVEHRRIRLCGVMELLLQVVILLSFWTLCLMLAFRFL